jgi:hypothetical protein
VQFRVADTFTDSLARLTGDEQKAVKTTAFDLQLNPANPGMSFHKLDKAKDKSFWSVRVSHRLIKGRIIAVPNPTAGSQTQASQDRGRIAVKVGAGNFGQSTDV